MFSFWLLERERGVKTSNLNIILCLAGVSAKPQGVPLVTILIFTVGSSLCLKLMILSSFQDLLVQPLRSDFREFWRWKVAELNFNLSWKLRIATALHSESGRSCYCSHGKDDGEAGLGLTGGGLCWECQHRGRGRPPAGPVSHEYTILRENVRGMSLVPWVLGVLAVIITLARQQILILNYNWHDDNMALQADCTTLHSVIMKTKSSLL